MLLHSFGRLPVRLLLEKSIQYKPVKAAHEVGSAPVSWLFVTVTYSRFFMLLQDSGSVPLMLDPAPASFVVSTSHSKKKADFRLTWGLPHWCHHNRNYLACSSCSMCWEGVSSGLFAGSRWSSDFCNSIIANTITVHSRLLQLLQWKRQANS